MDQHRQNKISRSDAPLPEATKDHDKKVVLDMEEIREVQQTWDVILKYLTSKSHSSSKFDVHPFLSCII
jgi:hypothetical protein